MKNHAFISDLFEPRPSWWGLRGDPYLWDELKESFAGVPLPASTDELEAVIINAYEQLTDHPFARTEHFRIDRYPQRGMSGGGISPKFWKETGLPLLLSRFEST